MKLEKPTHPGEILQKEFLEPMGLSQNRLSLSPACFSSTLEREIRPISRERQDEEAEE